MVNDNNHDTNPNNQKGLFGFARYVISRLKREIFILLAAIVK
ncbi:hypothetical protein ES703_51794 [subsurface metagenome]